MILNAYQDSKAGVIIEVILIIGNVVLSLFYTYILLNFKF